MTSAPGDTHDPVSPELVLVSSADVARRERDALPDGSSPAAGKPPTREAPGRPTAPAYPRAATDEAPSTDRPTPPVYPRVAAADAPSPPRRRSRRRLAIAAGFVLAAAVAAAGYVAATRGDGGGNDVTAVAPLQSPRATAGPPSAPAPTVGKEKRTRRTATRRPTTRAAAPAPAARPRATTRQTTRASGAPAFVPSRTWSWAPRAGAKRYRVTFFLNDHVVFEGRTAAARLVLPHGFRFRRGVYRWTVRALPQSASTKPVVDARFAVSRAAAAAANRR